MAVRRRRPQRGAPRIRESFGWWCWGENEKGRFVALGPHTSESAAYQEGANRYPGECRVVLLHTQNMTRAKQMLKAQDVQLGSKIDEALRYSSNQLQGEWVNRRTPGGR